MLSDAVRPRERAQLACSNARLKLASHLQMEVRGSSGATAKEATSRNQTQIAPTTVDGSVVAGNHGEKGSTLGYFGSVIALVDRFSGNCAIFHVFFLVVAVFLAVFAFAP